MLTPAMPASRTSEPCAIIDHAFSTPVTSPPFLNRFPLADEITTGFAGLRSITPGPLPRATAVVPAAVAATNVRRLMLIEVSFAGATYSIFAGGGSGFGSGDDSLDSSGGVSVF